MNHKHPPTPSVCMHVISNRLHPGQCETIYQAQTDWIKIILISVFVCFIWDWMIIIEHDLPFEMSWCQFRGIYISRIDFNRCVLMYFNVAGDCRSTFSFQLEFFGNDTSQYY